MLKIVYTFIKGLVEPDDKYRQQHAYESARRRISNIMGCV